jgi:3-(methylthio)propionyl---CoA ligase
MLEGLKMDVPLMITSLIEHAVKFHRDTAIVARNIEGDIDRYTYAQAGRRTKQLANPLLRRGIKPGEALAASHALMKPGSADPSFAQRIDRRLMSGRAMRGVRYRIVDDEERELPQDGVSCGHLRVKAPFVASGYFKGERDACDSAPFLKTGDIATIDADGHIVLTERAKDVIKSGGEWIRSIVLENLAGLHPEVLHAAVIGVAHPRWQERPLLIVVRRQGSRIDAKTLRDFLVGKVANFWLPDAVAFVDRMPMTGTGKIHKLTLRQQFADYTLRDVDPPGTRSRAKADLSRALQ